MAILANAYFDLIAATRGIVVLLFCIPIVLLCEFEVYRIVYPKQGVLRAVITCVYANIISWVMGLLIVNDKILDLFDRVSFEMFGRENDIVEDYVLFIFLFFLTWLVEGIAIYVFRKKLNIQKVFLGVGLANLISYVVSAVILFVFMNNQ